MEACKIDTLSSLKSHLANRDVVYLLLFRPDRENSRCADATLQKVLEEEEEMLYCTVDVRTVRDIHPEYGVKSVPSLLVFKREKFDNIYKGCNTEGYYRDIVKGRYSVGDSSESPQKRVVVYTSPTCTWCNTLKRHLDAYGVSYREVDVSREPSQAEALVRKSGQQGVPQTDINGKIIVGFDKDKINRELGIQ